jgi:hypothetical protein
MPRGPRKLAIEFGATTLTHYGGFYLLHRFLALQRMDHLEL